MKKSGFPCLKLRREGFLPLSRAKRKQVHFTDKNEAQLDHRDKPTTRRANGRGEKKLKAPLIAIH
jgi:hypothetical protein